MGARGRRATMREPAITDHRLAQVLNAVESAVILVDKKDRITALNDKAVGFLGDDADPATRPSFTDLVRRNFAPRLKDPKPLFDWL